MPVDDSGTISIWAFSKSWGSGVSCPVTAVPLAIFRWSQESSGFQESVASSHSLTAGVPHDLIAGMPQTSTVTVKSANGIQARAIRATLSARSGVVCQRPAAREVELRSRVRPAQNARFASGRQRRMTITPAAMLATDATMSTSSKPT